MRTAKVCCEVEKVWKTLTYKGRKTIRDNAMRAGDGDFRLRCKIVLNLARGESSTTIHQVLGCSLSQVYRIAKRFVQAGEAGLADGREDNGEVKVDDTYRAELVRLVDEDSPQDHGYRRPTWTQELLLLVMEQRTQVRISQSRMCRLLQELNIRLGLPKPVVGCPWRKQRRKRRLRQLRQLADTLPKGEVLV
jgi:transposase